MFFNFSFSRFMIFVVCVPVTEAELVAVFGAAPDIAGL